MRRTALAALAAAALVSACSGDPAPTFEPTDSPAPPVSSSPSQQPQSAEDFIREWVELHRNMQNTGDTSAFLHASGGCQACTKFAHLVANIYSKGGYIKTEGWRAQNFACTTGSVSVTSCDVQMEGAGTTYRRSGSAPVKRLPGGPFTETFTAKRVAGGWTMIEISERAT